MKSLPKFEDDNFQLRKDQYLKKGLEIFQNKLIPLTRDEYEKIRDDMAKGADVSLILMEKSLYHIVDMVATIYSKYDIERIISFDEGLNDAIYEYNAKVNDMRYLPYYPSEYIQHTIFTYIYRYFARVCKNKHNQFNQQIDITSPKEMVKLIDEKYEYQPDKKILFDETLVEFVSRLNQDEQEVLCSRLGLLGYTEKTYREIAAKLNYKEAKVRNIYANALAKLKSFNKNKELAYYYDMSQDSIN